MERRNFIKMFGASLVLWQTPLMSLASSVKPAKNSPKVIWVVLRGALDSLHTVVPTFDPNLRVLRPKLLASIEKELLMLDNGYGLHPSLKNMHKWYLQKEMSPIVAVSSGFSNRSHFDGQDYLESGNQTVQYESGWLGRAVSIKNIDAFAIAQSTPISLRSSDRVNTWYPSDLKEADNEIYTQLMNMYQYDTAFLEKLQDGMEIQGLAEMDGAKKQKGKFVELAKSCATLMTSEKHIDCAMLELGGWDTHNNQAARLERQLSELDNGLAALKAGLGDEWKNTVVIVATEFGRTAKENGTGGTDHGTGSAMFVAGGAVSGGKVLGKWPGLESQQLFKERDLMPTSNTFSWISTLLAQHWQLTDQQLATVFPKISPYSEKLAHNSHSMLS